MVSACLEATSRINVSGHLGGHPRLAAVDLVPFHPLDPDDSALKECGEAAMEVEERLRGEGWSVAVFEEADREGKRSLSQRRRELGWFKVGMVNG